MEKSEEQLRQTLEEYVRVWGFDEPIKIMKEVYREFEKAWRKNSGGKESKTHQKLVRIVDGLSQILKKK